jgi:uncharacterized paraquat-inducible protein A
MSNAHPDRLQEFMVGWLALVVCVAVALARVKTPYIKWLLTRAGAILGAALCLIGVWLFSETTNELVFAALSITIIVILNFFTIRVCPHCAKTLYPRNDLARGFCPRCGANMSANHERRVTWREGA